MRQCSGANRIIHVKRQKSGNTAQIRGGIHWEQIILPMYLTQLSLQKQYSLAECRQSQWLEDYGIYIHIFGVHRLYIDLYLNHKNNWYHWLLLKLGSLKSYLDILSCGKSGLQNIDQKFIFQSVWGSPSRGCFNMKSFIQHLSIYWFVSRFCSCHFAAVGETLLNI